MNYSTSLTPSQLIAPRVNVHGNCASCPFRTATCGSKGPRNSIWAIVGESPGRDEIKEGVPFVEPSGQLLDQALDKVFRLLRIKPIEPFITNALMCHPQDKDVHKLVRGASSCHPRLRAELVAHPRKVVLAMGNPAAWSCTDDYSIKITQSRGTIYPSRLASAGVVAAVHP